MGLEEEVTKLMDDVLDRSPPMLEALTGEKGGKTPLTPDETIMVIQSQIRAVRLGVQFLAREIDKMGGA